MVTKRNDTLPAATLVTLCGQCHLEEEYAMTVRVLAVVVERLQQLTGSDEIQIADRNMSGDLPDLHAWRNENTATISLTTAR